LPPGEIPEGGWEWDLGIPPHRISEISPVRGYQDQERRFEMKFRDLFLPKLAHSDPKVRKKAVLKEKDSNILKKVIENDKNPDVRRAANRRLKDLSG
jgi:hypothetical protein